MEYPPLQVELATSIVSAGDLINLFGIVVGVGLIAYQLHRQHLQNLVQKKEQVRLELQLEIFREVEQCCSELSDANLELSGYVRTMCSNVKLQPDMRKIGLPERPLRERAVELLDRNVEYSNRVIELICLLERFEIADPKLKLIRRVIGQEHNGFQQLFSDLHTVALRLLPVDYQDESSGTHTVLNVKLLTSAEIDKLQAHADPVLDSLMNVSCFVADLGHSIQNLFLSEIFDGRKVDYRVPLEKAYDEPVRNFVFVSHTLSRKGRSKYGDEETSISGQR